MLRDDGVARKDYFERASYYYNAARQNRNDRLRNKPRTANAALAAIAGAERGSRFRCRAPDFFGVGTGVGAVMQKSFAHGWAVSHPGLY
jgi:hypothetical protein